MTSSVSTSDLFESSNNLINTAIGEVAATNAGP